MKSPTSLLLFRIDDPLDRTWVDRAARSQPRGGRGRAWPASRGDVTIESTAQPHEQKRPPPRFDQGSSLLVLRSLASVRPLPWTLNQAVFGKIGLLVATRTRQW